MRTNAIINRTALRKVRHAQDLVHDLNLLTTVPAATVRVLGSNLVILTDDNLEGYSSVTNAAEWVIKRLDERQMLGERRVLYRDSVGYFDSITHESGRFTGFAYVRPEQQASLRNILNYAINQKWPTHPLHEEQSPKQLAHSLQSLSQLVAPVRPLP